MAMPTCKKRRLRDHAVSVDRTCEELTFFQRMLGGKAVAVDFFETKWETTPHVYVNKVEAATVSNALLLKPPLCNFKGLLAVLKRITMKGKAMKGKDTNIGTARSPPPPPAGPYESSLLVFKNGTPVTTYDSPSAAYLDGCSLVINHLEGSSEETMHVCQQLRQVLSVILLVLVFTSNRLNLPLPLPPPPRTTGFPTRVRPSILHSTFSASRRSPCG